MKKRILALVYAAIASAVSLSAATSDDEWQLPNFASRLSVEVRNDGNSQLQALATLPIAKAQAAAA